MKKLRIIVSGYIGLYPTGGVTWDYIQYPLGLKMLGHDVYYIEDTMQYSTFQTNGKKWNNSSDSILYLKQVMERFGLSDKWAYKDIASGKYYGLSEKKVSEIFKTADIFINISESTYLRDEYLKIPNKVLIDSDPMFTQVQFWNDDDPERSSQEIKDRYGEYDNLFTFGENINTSNCKVPSFNLNWIPTRQPVCLKYWKNDNAINPLASFTTVMNWSTRKKLRYKNEEWGQKDVEFEKILELPQLMKGSDFEIVVSCSAGTPEKFKKTVVENSGWKVLDPETIIRTTGDYQSLINSSIGEFSVAKETYVKSNSGWFSCRSACYLASGRPVVTQETGWSRNIPSGNGVFAFTNKESAIEALTKIKANPVKNARAATELAAEFFDSNKVLQSMLDKL